MAAGNEQDEDGEVINEKVFRAQEIEAAINQKKFVIE